MDRRHANSTVAPGFVASMVATGGLSRAAYEGRKLLAKEAAANYSRIRQLCPEDIGALESRIRQRLVA